MIAAIRAVFKITIPMRMQGHTSTPLRRCMQKQSQPRIAAPTSEMTRLAPSAVPALGPFAAWKREQSDQIARSAFAYGTAGCGMSPGHMAQML